MSLPCESSAFQRLSSSQNLTKFGYHLNRLQNYFRIFSAILSVFFIFVNELNAQLVESNLDSLSKQTNGQKSDFQLQRLKFARFLQIKYFLVDSLARSGDLFQIPNLKFTMMSPEFGLIDSELPIYPEFHQPLWMRDHSLRASGGYEQLMFRPVYLHSLLQEKQDWEKSKKEFKKDRIPNNLQLHVLNVLWKEKSATQLDIYSGIDSASTITAAKLDVQLERMVQLGLVERKLVSPQNLFTIVTPFKSYQIEKSSKNRKNRRCYSYSS